jgi:hypothetical protein
MSKYLTGSGTTGKIDRITSADEIKSNIIDEQMKKELVEEMKKEERKKVVIEDFTIKPVGPTD